MSKPPAEPKPGRMDTCGGVADTCEGCSDCMPAQPHPAPEPAPTMEAKFREMGSLAAKLSLLVMSAYRNNDEAAMRAFGNNAAGHIAKQLAGKLMMLKIEHPPSPPESDEPTAEPKPNEYAWLIEMPGAGVPHYYCAESYEWSSDHLLAVRFARRQDAERVRVKLPDGHLAKSIEHGWMSPAQPNAPAPEPCPDCWGDNKPEQGGCPTCSPGAAPDPEDRLRVCTRCGVTHDPMDTTSAVLDTAPEPSDQLQGVLRELFDKHGFGIAELASIHAALVRVVRETAERFATRGPEILSHWGLEEPRHWRSRGLTEGEPKE